MKTKKYILVLKGGKYQQVVNVEKGLEKGREYFINTKTNKVFWRELFNDSVTKINYVGDYIEQSNNLINLVKENDFVQFKYKNGKVDEETMRLCVKSDTGLKIENLPDEGITLNKIEVLDIYRSYQKGKYVSILN